MHDGGEIAVNTQNKRDGSCCDADKRHKHICSGKRSECGDDIILRARIEVIRGRRWGWFYFGTFFF